MRIVGSQNRTEIELDPVKAYWWRFESDALAHSKRTALPDSGSERTR